MNLDNLYDLEPRIAGDTLPDGVSIADHLRRLHALVGEEQSKISPDNVIIGVLCDSVRLVREHLGLVNKYLLANEPGASPTPTDAPLEPIAPAPLSETAPTSSATDLKFEILTNNLTLAQRYAMAGEPLQALPFIQNAMDGVRELWQASGVSRSATAQEPTPEDETIQRYVLFNGTLAKQSQGYWILASDYEQERARLIRDHCRTLAEKAQLEARLATSENERHRLQHIVLGHRNQIEGLRSRVAALQADQEGLLKFAGIAIHDVRGASVGNDWDGGSIQEAMEACGLIKPRAVVQPCGEGCECAATADFPTTCYHLTGLGERARAARSTPPDPEG